MKFVRRHSLALVVAVLAAVSEVGFVWAEYGYFCDQAASHKEKCEGFWSAAHLHDLIYNAASNWQSELIFGILIIVVLKDIGLKEPANEN